LRLSLSVFPLIGEQIAAVDGHPIRATKELADQTGWRYATAGAVVLLSLTDGSAKRLVLMDYY